MGKRVLVVEDDRFIGEVIAASLLQQGYLVDIVPDGRHVWQYLKHRRPSLILLDLSLPNEDGLTICRKLRGMPATASTPVVVVSAMSQPPTVQAVMDAGANDFIKKPFDIDDLVLAARTYVRQATVRRKPLRSPFLSQLPIRRPA